MSDVGHQATPREVLLWDTLHEVAYALFNEPQAATSERPELPMSAERCHELWRIARAALYPHHEHRSLSMNDRAITTPPAVAEVIREAKDRIARVVVALGDGSRPAVERLARESLDLLNQVKA